MKFFIISLLFLLIIPVFVFAANLEDAFMGGEAPLGTVGDESGYKGAGTDSANVSVESIISTIIQIALSFLGVIFLILMIYGGSIWMTAQGNEQDVEKAKNLITAAIIGLIIVLSAYAISYLVINKLGGAALKSS